jgi:hypothetical protein
MYIGFNCAVTPQSQANFNVLSGNLEYVQKYWKDHDILPTTQGANLAARNNYLDILKFLHNNGVKADSMGAVVAAEKGYIDTIRFLVSEDIGMFGVADAALSRGHVNIVEFLTDNCNLIPTRRGVLLAKLNHHDKVAEEIASKYGIIIPKNVVCKRNIVFKDW